MILGRLAPVSLARGRVTIHNSRERAGMELAMIGAVGVPIHR